MSTDTEPRAVNFAAPAGRLILPVESTRTAWLATRRRGLGGSDVAAVLGMDKYTTPFALWSEKTHDGAPVDEGTEAMWWGTHTEALTVDRFEQRTGLQTRRAGTYAHRDHDHHLVNPDRFTHDGGVLEVKDHESLSDAGKQLLKGEVTDRAFVQLQWACHVTGRSHGWFAAKVGKQTVVLGPFDRDEAFIARMVDAADRFWDLVQTRTAPPLDLGTADADEIAARFPTVTPDACVDVTDQPIPEIYLDDLARLDQIRAGAQELAGERDAIEKRLKALIGDREYLTVNGRPVWRWQEVAGRRAFDKDTAVAELARLTGRTPVEVEADLTKRGRGSRRFIRIEKEA